MKSPWKSLLPLEAGRTYLVLASSIPTKRITSAWRMFRGSRAVGRQLRATDGVAGFSLLAQPFSNRYATLSVWTGEAALAGFVATDPHADIMARLSSELGDTIFERWSIDGGDGRPTWREALQRLER